MNKQLVLLEFEMEKPVDLLQLNRLASQVCWSMDKVSKCEHVDLGRVHLVVKGEAPDGLYVETVQAALEKAKPTVWSRFKAALKGWFGRGD